MTIDDTTLAAALRDLAGTVTDEPGRLVMVHQRARRLRRRRHTAGATVLAATLAGGLVGAEYLRGGGAGSRLATPATSPPAGSPACPALPGSPGQTAVAQPPAIGQQFTAGGVVASPPSAVSVTVDVQGGPLAGSVVTLGITSGTTVTVLNADGTGETPSTASQLHTGQTVKFFAATRTGATAYVANEIHAAPAATPATPATPAGGGSGTRASRGVSGNGIGPATSVAGGAAASPSAAAAKAAAAAAGNAAGTAPGTAGGTAGFKVQGVVVAVTAHSLTVRVDAGAPTGTVTFALTSATTCQPQALRAGDRVLVAGAATAAGTYDADIVAVIPPAPTTTPTTTAGTTPTTAAAGAAKG